MLKEKLINYLKNVVEQEQQAGFQQAGREEAIEYLKANHYTLSEENVLYAMKKISEGMKKTDIDMVQFETLNLDELVNVYNQKLAEFSHATKQPVHPGFLIRSDEEVKNAFYVHNRIDRRANDSLSDEIYQVFDYGCVGRVYVTNKRILGNYAPTIYPFTSTICFDLKNIVSMSITGNEVDTIEIVLTSGQKINFSICENGVNIIDLVKTIDALR